MGSAFADSDLDETLATPPTLGTASLLGIFFGFVMICGTFFGFGYSFGRHSFSQSAAPNARPDIVVASTAPKQARAAIATAPALVASPTPIQSSAQIAIQNQPAAATNGVAGIAIPKPSAIRPVMEQTTVSIPYVRPVPLPPIAIASPYIPKVYTPPFDVHPNTRPAAETATVSTQLAMVVQIAAMSRQEDAERLASALRQRGYATLVHIDASDSLYCVQVGPYQRSVALAARKRLKADGYNAVLK